MKKLSFLAFSLLSQKAVSGASEPNPALLLMEAENRLKFGGWSASEARAEIRKNPNASRGALQ
jgi:hypothetical protein